MAANRKGYTAEEILAKQVELKEQSQKPTVKEIERAITILIDHLDFFIYLVKPESQIWFMNKLKSNLISDVEKLRALKQQTPLNTITEFFKFEQSKTKATYQAKQLLKDFWEAFNVNKGEGEARGGNNLIDFVEALQGKTLDKNSASLLNGKTEKMRYFLSQNSSVVAMLIKIENHPAIKKWESTDKYLMLREEYKNELIDKLSYQKLNAVRKKLNSSVKFYNYILEPLGGDKYTIRADKVRMGKDAPDDNSPFAKFYIQDLDVDKQSKWKAHISVHAADLENAWELILPILIFHEVPYFKVVRLSVAKAQKECLIQTPEEAAEMQRVTEGMQISLYPYAGDESRYNKIFLEIEKNLTAANIRPGKIHASDKQLGTFISVRHAGNFYRPGVAVANYNPDQAEDPFIPLDKFISLPTPK